MTVIPDDLTVKPFYDTPEYSPPDATADPAGVLSQLLGDLAQLRGMLLGAGVQIEMLEKESKIQGAMIEALTHRIVRLESGGY